MLIGVVLGLTGGGGSILTVPILVYVLSINPIVATAYSLFVVGGTALFGTLKNIQRKMIDYRTAFVFAVPSFIAVYLTRKFVIPTIPDVLFSINTLVVTKELFIMIFFAVIMFAASIAMIKGRAEVTPKAVTRFNYPLIVLEGSVVGFLTGLVGAGGGFLIIPALVLLANLPMKKAVATSLMIIAVKSLVGFLGDVGNISIDWEFLLTFTSISIVGIIFGIYLNKYIDGKKLKKGFGWLVLVMSIYILLKELI